MQNAQTSLANDDNLDLAQGPTSLTSLPETTTLKDLAPTPPGEAVQSDTEIRPKVKGRSRFSTAIRKLSGSTRKKQQQQQQSQKDSTGDKASTAGSTSAETTSGTEKLPISSRHEDEKEIEKKKFQEKDKGKEAQKEKEKAKVKEKEQEKAKDKEKEKEKLKDKEKEKEKLKDKEKEKEKLKEKEKEKEKEKLKDKEKEKEKEQETDQDQQKTKKKSRLSKKFLLPALKKSKISPKTNIDESENVVDEVVEISSDTSKSAKQSRVQITISGKKVEQQLASPEADYLTPSEDKQRNPNEKVIEPTTVESSKVKKKLKSKKTGSICTRTPSEEKLVITQSVRDAPPSEKAPLKPSRSLAGTSQPIESTETFIRKPTVSSTAATSSSTIAQRFIGGTATSPKQRFGVGLGIKTASVEADLMQTPSSSFQRGHRLPRPSSTTTEPTTAAITPPPSSSSSKIVTPAESTQTHFSELSPQLQQQLQQQRQKQRQIQFQLQSESSHASQSLPQPSSDVSSEVALLLQPPTYPPPPVPIGPAVTPQSRSLQLHQQHTIPYADKSVATASSNVADELPSSAESAGYQEQDYDAEVASYLGAANKDSERLRRQGTTTSADSIKSSGSQSPHSESSRKRIHYIAQPTLYDETVNRRQRSDDFKLTTEASEHIFEADSTDSGDKQMPAFGDLAMDEEMEPTIMTTANAEKREHLYKILVIGELGTGKTSFIKRYVHQFFSQNYRATIGVDFALKVLHWDPNTIVRLQLWDIAGQERFGNMTRVYYKEAVGAFIVFDVTRSGTFECVSKWKEDLDSKVQLPDGSPIPCILLANKCDQEKQGIVTQTEKMDEYVKENGFSGWFETSAKENTNIDEAARALVSKILLNDKLISAADLADSEKFNLNNAADQTDLESKKCSC